MKFRSSWDSERKAEPVDLLSIIRGKVYNMVMYSVQVTTTKSP